MDKVQQLIRARESKFVEDRTKIEIEVGKFFESIKDIEDEIKDIPGRPVGSSAKEVLPSLWVEPFDIERYKAELSTLQEYINNVVAYGNRINEEALRCLRV